MKRIISVFAAALFCLAASAQTPKDVKFRFTEASELNLIGKIMDNTPNPYHRVDTVLYKGFTTGENRQVRCPTGLAVLFKTNSTVISVKTEWGWEYSSVATMPIAYRGYDLYIKRRMGVGRSPGHETGKRQGQPGTDQGYGRQRARMSALYA